MIKNYKVRLHVLTPIHIGMGDCYDPTQFVFDKDGHMWVFDTNDFLKSLSPEKSAEFCKLAANSNNSIPVFRFFRDNFDRNKITCRQIKASSDLRQRYDEILASGSLKKDAINQFELKRTIFNPIKNVPYIPGSSLKGCLKTFWMSEMNRRSENPIVRDPERKPSRYDLNHFEEVYLKGSFSNDPFRFIKVSDLYPVENEDTFLTRMMYAVMFSKSDRDNEQKANKRAPLPDALEVIPKGNIFEGVISFDDQSELPNCKQVQKISMADLRKYATFYYYKHLNKAEWKDSKMLLEKNELQRLGVDVAYMNSVKDCYKNKKTAFPVRIGHHSSAEFITIDGCRSINIIPKQPVYSDHSTTIWLASSKKKPDSPRELQPFGWALLDFEEMK